MTQFFNTFAHLFKRAERTPEIDPDIEEIMAVLDRVDAMEREMFGRSSSDPVTVHKPTLHTMTGDHTCVFCGPRQRFRTRRKHAIIACRQCGALHAPYKEAA